MNRSTLIDQIKRKNSYLCVGLDTDISRIPPHLCGDPDPVVAFNKAIIEATRDFCVAYKINTAFYEAQGLKGWTSLEKTVSCIPDTHLKIADAKRGDIGNTSAQYARTFFEVFPFDAVTVAPYMGEDSIRPFLEYEQKFTIVLGLTSNRGAADFELQKTGSDYLYEKVLRTVSGWGTPENLMFVIGATQASQFTEIRKIIPEHFLLVPGIGFQGGDLQETSVRGLNRDGGLLVNASRAIIYAGKGEDFAAEAGKAAKAYQQEMARYLGVPSANR